MINNRQNGRRRGRGGNGQPQRNGQAGGADRGSRIDNRSRGNAAQLHEKYKTLARDAQMQGDRVNIEYYLQFADHYFRVLNENRARFDEQRPRREDNRGGEDYANDGEGDDGFGGDDQDEFGDEPMAAERPRRDYQREDRQQPQPQPQPQRAQREERPDRGQAPAEPERNGLDRADAEDGRMPAPRAAEASAGADEPDRRPRRRNTRNTRRRCAVPPGGRGPDRDGPASPGGLDRSQARGRRRRRREARRRLRRPRPDAAIVEA